MKAFTFLVVLAAVFYLSEPATWLLDAIKSALVAWADSKQSPPPGNSPGKPVTSAELPAARLLLRDVNAYRVANGLRPLVYSATCAAAAKLQAQNNRRLNECEHYNNADYPTIGDRLMAAHHRYARHAGFQQVNGENMLRFPLVRDSLGGVTRRIFRQYHNSPKHDAMMLNPSMTKFGAFTEVDASGEVYNGEVFAI